MSPPDLRPFWRVLEHIKSEYLHAKEVAFSSGSESTSTSKPPPGQWCYEYCTARRRGADVGYVDESCLCGYEKEDLKRKADERHVKSKRSLEKRQRFREVEDAATSDSSTDTALVEQPTLDLPTSSISPSVTAAGVTSPAQASNNGGAPPLATVTSPSTTPISTPTSEVTVIATSEASNNNNSGNGGLSSGAKIGLGVGLGVGIAALIALIALLCLRRRRRRSHNTPSSSSTKHLPQQQSDLSMVEATQPSQPQSRGLAEEPSKPTYYNSYEIYHPPTQHAHQPLDDDAPSATMHHPPGPGQDIFQTPVSAITPTLDNNHAQQQNTRSPPTLSISTQQDHAPSPTDHSQDGAGPSPVSPISPVSALSSRPPSPTPKHGGGGHG